MTNERNTLIDSLRRFPTQLETLVGQVYTNQLTVAYVPGAWSVAQNVHHLADSHMNAYTRMRLILTEDRPVFRAYDQDAWANLNDSMSMSINMSLHILRGLHFRWAEMLQALPEEAWQRVGIHPETGEHTLESMLTDYVNHGVGHLDQIMQVLAARPLVYNQGVTYEVIVDVTTEFVEQFEHYMLQKHIPEIFATGLFRHIQFDRASQTRFRTAYIAENREALDTYLHTHSSGFRADFLKHMPDGVSVVREIWDNERTWGSL